MASSPSKYNMNLNPAYQIDWATAASGKRVSATKRRVRFRFGFSNRDALAKGLTGNECRGEEHEVSLIWSLTSGKRLVIFDGNEVHFSQVRDNNFAFSWPMKGGHLLKIVAYAAPPLRATPGFRQFDLLLDGMSFFDMPRIFELGVKKQHHARVSHAVVTPTATQNSFDYNNHQPVENRRHDGAVRRLEDEHSMRSYPSTETASQGFSGPSRRKTMEPTPVVATNKAAASPLMIQPQDVLSELPRGGVDLLESPSSVQVSTVDEFTPVEVKPTFQDVSNQILSAYGPPPTAPAPLALANESHTHHTPTVQTPSPPQYQGYPNAPQQMQTHYQGHPNLVSPVSNVSTPGFHSGHHQQQQQQTLAVDPNVASPPAPPVITPTMMKPLEVDELRDSPPPIDAMDQAVQNLVNLNDLTETKSTPEQIKAKKQKEMEHARANTKSRPKPPAATDWHVGQNASLADIQQHKKPPAPPSKEVMKMHAFDPAAAQAGMMVVYGQPQQAPHPHQGGGNYARSIPAATGFGAGMHQGYALSVRADY